MKSCRFSGISPPFFFSRVCECLNAGSVRDCGSRSTVRSNCRAVFGRETGLIREEVRENIMSPLSSFTVSPIFCLPPSSPPPHPPLTLYMTTQNDGSPARLINRQRETDGHKRERRRERGDVERPVLRLLKHRLPRCFARRLPTTSKPLDARRGATRAAK